MAMLWRSRKQGVPAWYVCCATTGRSDAAEKQVPKGYVPMVLVDGEDDGDLRGQRIMVHVRMLREPCMAALLEMAAQQFGHDQRGVLRVPCNVIHFRQMLEAAR